MIAYGAAWRGRGRWRAPAGRRPATPGRARAVVDCRAGGAGRPVRRAAAAERRRRRASPSRRWRRRLGRAAGRQRACDLAERGGRGVVIADDPLRGAAAAGARLAQRARLQGDRRDRLDRQDLDEGHPAGDPRAAAAHPRQPRELEHRDRAAADACSRPSAAPRRWCSRWRCAARARSRELAAIAEPDVGVIVSVGPVHLELLGTVERVAAAKAELIARPADGAAGVVPAGEPLLDPHLRDDLDDHVRPGRRCDLVTFDAARPRSTLAGADRARAAVRRAAQLLDALAAVAAATAIGVTARGASTVAFSSRRGELVELEGGVTIVTTATTPTRCRCARHSTHLAAPRGRAARRRMLGGDGRARRRTARLSTARSASTPAQLGVDVLRHGRRAGARRYLGGCRRARRSGRHAGGGRGAARGARRAG